MVRIRKYESTYFQQTQPPNNLRKTASWRDGTNLESKTWFPRAVSQGEKSNPAAGRVPSEPTGQHPEFVSNARLEETCGDGKPKRTYLLGSRSGPQQPQSRAVYCDPLSNWCKAQGGCNQVVRHVSLHAKKQSGAVRLVKFPEGSKHRIDFSLLLNAACRSTLASTNNSSSCTLRVFRCRVSRYKLRAIVNK